ncbi:MAG: cytochrome d ubiquinol oxidase subunit II [Ilumatobacter fluminis]|uniref:Cytochrome bd-I ubiquinol oxidase subunit 2 apoprotein n=1 Tax=Ilumatobacter fluminis TaxID=467091 RepID=A0A4V3EIY7_9ACTN|nr:cytochrome d ubiquinol oxidase subunit II [Ilumatobacter fluminis]TDT16138.1 cytochrome bd-I ubiquinol oxidase subunit 2 apoprotein [Ilumatobacter fluminis]
MELTDFWFIIIAVLWTGYFFLEGFDFGVGMLLHPLSNDEIDRRVMINTIGPVWDGNEVWLLTAGGATFAAFPNWYASLFSGFYLALFLILIALIVRGVAFEYRGKVSTKRWKSTWDLMIAIGSWVPAILWGVAFANIVHGVPIDADGNFTGNLFTLITPYSLLGGVTIAALCAFHGANFLALKTTGDIQGRSQSAATMLGAVAVVLGGSFLLWTQLDTGEGWTWIPLLLAAVGLVASIVAGRAGRDGWAFVGTGAAIAFAIVMLFGSLYPDVLPSTIDPAYSLTVDNASSADYTLKVMTVVALVMTPVVLLYQAWTYWIFRKRVGRHHIPTSAAH